MIFIPSVDSYASDIQIKHVWEPILALLQEKQFDGISYYKHPIFSTVTDNAPDITFLARNLQPTTLHVVANTIDEILSVDENFWVINGKRVDSPFLMLEDFLVALKNKFTHRRLRKLINPVGILSFPMITQEVFSSKFKDFSVADYPFIILWKDTQIENSLIRMEHELSDQLWRLAKSVFQGVNPLNKDSNLESSQADLLGDAITILEREIAVLDDEQLCVAIQMAPGPQRIRGLAGTGKTVVLAMKAANIHNRYPDRKILFTFNTQSLYPQAKSLITKFYREYKTEDPNWENLHIRHAWGGKERPGTYSEACERHDLRPLTLSEARNLDKNKPFAVCCKLVLESNIEPFYDYILVDETQDFPIEYCQLLGKLIKDERRIYFAYDELQSLSEIEMASPEVLFGAGIDGKPVVVIDAEDYPGQIARDFILHKSYRCPLEVLMLAHAIGLGIHNKRGCVQMPEKKDSWESIGYTITEGDLSPGSKITISRPKENSPNRASQIYTGKRGNVEFGIFESRQEELLAVAKNIALDINKEKVKPEHIVVICMDNRQSRDHLLKIQQYLDDLDIKTTVPGLSDKSWKFAEEGYSTLSTVYRAKGNEAPVVYIIAFDIIDSYADEVEYRNAAFTGISRAKGWVRISGAGAKMQKLNEEIAKIMEDIPELKFVYPNMKDVRRKLDTTETYKRKRQVQKANASIETLTKIDPNAFVDLDPVAIRNLIKKLREVSGDD